MKPNIVLLERPILPPRKKPSFPPEPHRLLNKPSGDPIRPRWPII